MLLHKLPIELTNSYTSERAWTLLEFDAVPRISVWSWLGPVAGAEAAMAMIAPMALLAGGGASSLWLVRMLCAASASLAIWFMAAQSQKLYRPMRGPQAFRLSALSVTCLMWLAGLGVVMLTLHAEIAIGTIVSTILASLVSVLLVRLWSRACLRARLRAGDCLDRVLVIATDQPAARAAATELAAESDGCIRAAACIAIPGTPGAPSLAWIEDAASGLLIDQVYVVGYDNLDVTFNELLPPLASLDMVVTLLSERTGAALAPACSTRIGRYFAIPLCVRAMGPMRSFAKRVMDVAIACTMMVVFSPLVAAIAIAIKLDSAGPVLFMQQREGLRGKVFRVLKFRTMFTHLADDAAATQTSRTDLRVTPVGRILRRFSLDELPQLLNVIAGDMSIVGPRPHAIGMTVEGRSLRESLADYGVRHRVKPGITGWAQINGCRGEVTTQSKLRRRVALDCEYIERCSIAMDMWIVLRTVAILFFDQHAY